MKPLTTIALFTGAVAAVVVTACSPTSVHTEHAAHESPTNAAVDAPLGLAVSTSPLQPQSGASTRLTFAMSAAGQRIQEFDTVHEKKLHLLIVSRDLSFFAHEHPVLQPDGTFVLDYVFSRAGAYRVFADFKATSLDAAVLSADLAVDGPTQPESPLRVSDLGVARSVGGYEVRLASSAPTAGDHAQLTFAVTKDGAPTGDLEPYLGAMGHLVVITGDGTKLLHAHPEDDERAAPGVVSFHTQFQSPGLYKAWAQFQARGEVITADFVFDVPSAPSAKRIDAVDHSAHRH